MSLLIKDCSYFNGPRFITLKLMDFEGFQILSGYYQNTTPHTICRPLNCEKGILSNDFR